MTLDQAYTTLGLPSGASKDEVRLAFKKLALQHHPDKGGDTVVFQKINEAYSVVSGKAKAEDQTPTGFDFGGFNFDFGGVSSTDWFNAFRGAQRHMPPENEDEIVVNMHVSISDIKRGRSFKIEYEKSAKCDDCNGAGGKDRKRCEHCGGTGSFRRQARQGGMNISMSTPCITCQATGYKIDTVCVRCDGNGFIIIKEGLRAEIKKRDE